MVVRGMVIVRMLVMLVGGASARATCCFQVFCLQSGLKVVLPSASFEVLLSRVGVFVVGIVCNFACFRVCFVASQICWFYICLVVFWIACLLV